jgi:hypothetical protein
MNGMNVTLVDACPKPGLFDANEMIALGLPPGSMEISKPSLTSSDVAALINVVGACVATAFVMGSLHVVRKLILTSQITPPEGPLGVPVTTPPVENLAPTVENLANPDLMPVNLPVDDVVKDIVEGIRA